MKKEMRKQLNETLDNIMEKDKTFVVCDADLACSSGLHSLFNKYPNQSVDFGISEANMIAAAGGMSQVGLKPLVHSFCPFITRRVMDQLYVSVGFAQNQLFVYASDPGYFSQYNGATHTSFEDIAITRSIPNITVFAPSDAICVDWILRYYAQHPSFIYARIPRREVPILYQHNETFTYGKAKVVKQGSDIAILCCGPEIHDALEIANLLKVEKNIDITVVDLLFLKPMDNDLIVQIAKTHHAICTLENHSRYGGIGEAVSAIIGELDIPRKPSIKILAVEDRYSEVGSVEYLKEKLHISKHDIYQACLDLIMSKEKHEDNKEI